MTRRLCDAALGVLDPRVVRPAYDRAALGVGIVHLGVGAFHRAHQAVYTEDAIVALGGDWGVCGVALQRPDTPDLLRPQDGLYTVETLSAQPSYRVVGVLKELLHAPTQREQVRRRLAAPTTHVVTLTVTEKAYALTVDGRLDENHPEIRLDLEGERDPASTVGWLVDGLSRRKAGGGGALTVVSCDNLKDNGAKLGGAVRQYAELAAPELVGWIDESIRFPNTMVDCIVPATTGASLERVEAAIGQIDAAPVQREPFSQWVIEDRFAGPRPHWEAAGAELVASVTPYEQLKLHVLNAAHSALAYLGIPRGHRYVREAIADPEIRRRLDEMFAEEIAPALPGLSVAAYWETTRARFANPMVDHALSQIAQDGSVKLPQRILPLLIANARQGRGTRRMAAVVKAWLELGGRGGTADPQIETLKSWFSAGAGIEAALDNASLFPREFRTEPAVRAAITRLEYSAAG